MLPKDNYHDCGTYPAKDLREDLLFSVLKEMKVIQLMVEEMSEKMARDFGNLIKELRQDSCINEGEASKTKKIRKSM